MKARVIDSFPAPTLDEIKRFEARNGVVLPEEYVEFLLASNGGLFTGEYALVGPPSDDRVDAIDLLYALNAPFDFWDLQTTTQDWKADCPNGRGFLPVGRDPYGNEYCLKVSRKLFGVFGGGRKKTGVVGLRERETGEIWKIADSFAAFLDNIYQSDGEETSPVCRIVEEGRVDGLKELLAQNAVDFAETSRNGLPLLTLAACRRQPEICRLLIEAGCDVDQKNADASFRDERRRYQSLNRRRSGRRSAFERRRDAFGGLGKVFASTSRDRIDQTRRPLRRSRRGIANA